MSFEKPVIGHRRMASPAEKGNIGLKCYPDLIACLVWNCCMTHQTDRFSVDLFYHTLVVHHAMRAYPGIKVLIMTEKTDLGPVCIGASSQELRCPGKSLSSMYPMTCQTSHLSIKERKNVHSGIIECPWR
jgi:hypothetical protein